MSEEKILKAFGRKLNSLRIERKLSQEKIAELAQLDRTYISSVERGRRNISLLNIYKLATALDVSPDSLLANLGDYNE
ncbi:helix-turn-helix transcriptional regulator [Yersinia enterocolitica]|uniref:helix-turn-helix domain-containing protein n=1 Tax=Yersinia TaxID=629 RepID=UPI0005AC7D9F|nr:MULTISPECIES: helix-turn-helix transcriptional regulator [Yersinia]HDL7478052.1 helix-turn-helix transcriptional regulator [Yersinia enterocolitica]AJJ61724.1 C.AhdI [Yersinia aldovae 670-83]EKN4698779.1 helix-turn-helix transcriptional regulator [Yersinia ruckeri]MCW6584942.1 helix-turn-helix domain-containing protein [Yersinia ruckeri]HDL7502841.1 helix-turn-helix transcriptional regulator [Yersinia enterocolitica]